jgi:predicted MFS family arabinose efflux permease
MQAKAAGGERKMNRRRVRIEQTAVKGRTEVLGIAWITALCLMGDSMLYVVLPLHWEEAGLHSLVQVGMILSVNRLIRLPLNPLVNWIYRRISLRQGMLSAVILAVITTASYGVANTFSVWIIMRCLWGLSWSFLRLGAYYAILELRSEHNQGRLFGIYNGHYRLGSLIGMLLGGGLADGYGLRTVSLLLAALSICCVPFLLMKVNLGKREDQEMSRMEPAERQGVSTLIALLKTKEVKRLLLTILGSAFIYEGMFTSTLSHYTETSHPSIALLGFTLGGALVSGGLQALRWGWGPFLSPLIGALSDRKLGKESLLIMTMMLACVMFLLFPLPLPTWLWLLAAVGILFASTCMSTLMDSIATTVSSQHDRHKRNVMTAYSIMIDLGAALGPVISYWLVQNTGYLFVYWGAATVLLGLSIRWYKFTRPRERSLGV